MPLLIGIFAICLLNGWIKINPQNSEFSEEWVNGRRFTLVAVSILSTGAGICSILVLSGIIDIHQP